MVSEDGVTNQVALNHRSPSLAGGRLEVHNQAVSRATLHPKSLGGTRNQFSQLLVVASNTRRPLAWSGIGPFSASLVPWPSTQGLLCDFKSFLMQTPIIGYRAHPNPIWPHHNLIALAQTLLTNEVTFKGTQQLRVEHNFQRGHNATYNNNILVFKSEFWSFSSCVKNSR